MKKHTQCMHSGTLEKRKELGITDGLFRLSVGIEDSADLLSDIEQAL